MSPDRQGSEELHVRIGRLRDAARVEAAAGPAPVREQLGLEDAAIQVASRLAGTNGADRRQAMRDVKIGNTVTARGTAKTTLTREEKAAKTLAWAKTLTEDQREQFIVSERFEGLSDSQQEAISEAFAEVTERECSDSIGIESIDYDAPIPEIDSVIGEDEDDDGSFEVQEGEDVESFDDLFEQASWEVEAT